MATEQECEQALHGLAERISTADDSGRGRGFDRTLTCTLPDLDVVFSGRFVDGKLVDIARASAPEAQIRLTMTSDDLLALVDGELNMGTAWATGRVKIDAGVRDLLRLRSIF